MKIFIITQNAPMYLAGFLDDFLGKVNKTSHDVEGISVLSPFFKKNVLQEIKDRYNYYGLIDLIKMAAHIAWNKLLSFVFQFFPSICCYSVDNVIRKYKPKNYKAISINSNDFVKHIKTNQIDLIISIASSEIFENEILNAPKKGCINYHTALLPKYRGRQPLFWALLNGEKEIGISIHEMDEKLDNGPIIVQRKIPVSSKDTLHSIYLKTINIGPTLLIEAIKKLDNDWKDRIRNDSNQTSYNSFPTKEDAKLFKYKGKSFF